MFWPISGEPPFQEPFFGIKWALKANYQSHQTSKRMEYEYPISTNSKRLRGKEKEYQKQHGEYRILLLGDSQTFGHGVLENERFSTHIEKFINNSKNLSQPKITVINAGMPGTGTYDQMIYLENEGIKYEPDLVVLCFYDNDLDDNVNRDFMFDTILYDKNKGELSTSGFKYHEYKELFAMSLIRFFFNSIPFYDYLSRNSNLINLIKHRVINSMEQHSSKDENKLVSLFQKENITKTIWFDRDFKNSLSMVTNEDGKTLGSILVTHLLISRMEDYTEKQNVDFLIVIIPTKEEVLGAIPARKYLFHGKNNEEITALHLADIFADIEKNNLSFLFYPADSHLSPTGDLVAAYYITLSIADLFFEKKYIDNQKIKDLYIKQIDSTRKMLINRLTSLDDYPEFHYYKALVLANSDLKNNESKVKSELKKYISLLKKENRKPNDLATHLIKTLK